MEEKELDNVKVGDRFDYLCLPNLCLSVLVTSISDDKLTCYCDSNNSSIEIERGSDKLYKSGTFIKKLDLISYLDKLEYPKDLVQIRDYGYDIIPFVEKLKGFDCSNLNPLDLIKLVDEDKKAGDYNPNVISLIYKKYITEHDILSLVSQLKGNTYERYYRSDVIKQINLPFVNFYSNVKIIVKGKDCLCVLTKNGKKVCYAEFKDGYYFFPYVPYIPSGFEIVVSTSIKSFKKKKFITDFKIECTLNRTDTDTALNMIRIFSPFVIQTKKSIIIVGDDIKVIDKL